MLQAVVLSVNDVLQGIDGATLSALLNVDESGIISEVTGIKIPIEDVGTGIDSLDILSEVVIQDVGIGIDSFVSSGELRVQDIGLGIDTTQLQIFLQVLDSVVGTDEVLVRNLADLIEGTITLNLAKRMSEVKVGNKNIDIGLTAKQLQLVQAVKQKLIELGNKKQNLEEI